jgi:mRNA-degrading endonuclease RelE of RelBE toxin-antitoxin system
MYTIRYTPSARDDLHALERAAVSTILQTIDQQLGHQPLTPTRNRKLLRPNALANWELRVGRYRIFYDADATANLVEVKAVGWKEHNKLFIRGQEYVL